MDDAPAQDPANGDLIPDVKGARPEVTIRSQTTGFLVYDIDPEEIPTETITRGGRRIFLDENGALRESHPELRSNYELLDKISEGGAGIIYRVQEKTLKREVALKICRAELKPNAHSTLAAAGEFTNEAYMTARLDHPGVVPIYALAKDAEGRPFFAMKKVSGTSWKDLLHPETLADPARREAAAARARSLHWRDHLDILLKVCDAVAYAHNKAILHRDLKPENIMLGDYGEVFVMDWGLALYFDERNEYKRYPELKPQLAGTPSYIAPEMVRGEMTALGPATDVYLLGGILYEILTGRPPHDGETVMDVLRSAARGVVTPPEEISDAPHVPALARIAMKALERRIADRYPAVAAFQQDLREVLANSESMAICRRAADRLAAVRHDLLAGDLAEPAALKEIDEDSAAICYGQLSECIGSFRQAVELWAGNLAARHGLLEALALQIRLAIRQDDLTLARAQSRLLEALRTDCPDPALAAEINRQTQELAAQILQRQALLDRAARHARRWKTAAAALGLLTLAGVAAIIVLALRQRALSITREKDMFAASVTARAQILGQFMVGIEQISALYRQTAEELLASPPGRLPWREPTSVGRDGFYYDEDFARPATQPPDMAHNPRYDARLSMSFPTVVRAPWARDEAHRPAVEDAAARLGRLNTLFAHFHRSRRDIQWSIAGSESGLVVGFPGYARYQDQPDYDPTRRAWYQSAIQATNDSPVWGPPYADATTQLLLMSCMSRIQVHGRNTGVVGLEITLDTLQRLLLDFSLSVGGKRRGLLIRPAEEPDPLTGGTRTVHRVIVDTLYPRTTGRRQAGLDLATIQHAGPDVADYYFDILAGHHRPGATHEKGNLWLAHMPVQNRTWTFIALLERD
jgi:serine/threonine protein kinase